MLLTPSAQTQVITDLLAGILFGSAATMNVRLSKTAFNAVNLSGFTEADFDGYAAKVGSGWADGKDPVTGNKQLTLLPPAGGLRWVVGANGTANQSIFGFAIWTGAGNIPVGGQIFTAPVPITAPGDQVNVGVVETQLQQAGFQ